MSVKNWRPFCAGWVAPVYALLQQKLINKENCDYTKALTEYFSGGVCLAGMPEDSQGYAKLTSICSQKSQNEGGFLGKWFDCFTSLARNNDRIFYQIIKDR